MCMTFLAAERSVVLRLAKGISGYLRVSLTPKAALSTRRVQLGNAASAPVSLRQLGTVLVEALAGVGDEHLRLGHHVGRDMK